MKLLHHLHLLFLPHEKNNHRAFLLQPSFLAILIAVYLLNQSILNSISTLKPGVLGYSSEITISKVFSQTNQQRQASGVATLKYNDTLSKSAQAKANDMFVHNYWAHTSPGGVTPWDFFKQNNYEYSIAGENLAKDFYDTDSMMKAWMNSPTHRANILNQKYQEIGIAVVNGTLNGMQTTLVVQHFGTPLKPVIDANNPVPTDAQMEQTAVLPSTPEVLATSQTAINPLMITKLVGGVMFLLIMGVLVADVLVTLKKKHYRIVGSSLGHISFLAIIFVLLLISKQGRIF